MADSTINIPEGFEPLEEEELSVPEGFEPIPDTPMQQAMGIAEEATGLGLNYLRGRTFGLGEKGMAAIAAPMAKIPLEAVESVKRGYPQRGYKAYTEPYSGYEAPSVGALYTDIVRDVQGKVEQSQEQYPALSAVAEGAGGVRTALQAGGTKVAQGITNWAKGAPTTGMPLAQRAAALFSKTGKQIGLGATGYAAYKQGIADPSEQFETIVPDLATGGTIAGVLGLGGSAVAGGVKAAIPKVDEALLPVVELAQKYGIPTSLDQIASSKPLEAAQKLSQEIPFSGHKGFRDKQMAIYQNRLIKTFGEDSDAFTPELMDTAFTRLGKEFDNFAKGKKYDGKVLQGHVDDFLKDAEEVYSTEAYNAVAKRLKAIASDFSKDGTLSGKKLSFHRAKVNELARKANDFDKQSIYRDLEAALIETATEGDEALKAGFSKTKEQYKNLIVLEPLAKKAKGGKISPALLNNRVSKVYGRQHTRGQSGEIGELARIGHELLPELGGSHTTPLGLYAGGTVAGVAAPAVALPLIAAGAAANRGLQKWINQNPASVQTALEKAYRAQIKGAVKPALTTKNIAKEVIE